MGHPVVRLSASVSATDYRQFSRRCPMAHPITYLRLLTPARKVLCGHCRIFWPRDSHTEDLNPVPLDLIAANKSPIDIAPAEWHFRTWCACLICICGLHQRGSASISLVIDLGIISHDFPSVGSAQGHSTRASSPPAVASRRRRGLRLLNAGCSSAPQCSPGLCSCPPRTAVPERPSALPSRAHPRTMPK